VAEIGGDARPLVIDVTDEAAIAAAAAGAVRLTLLPDDGPTGGFFSWEGSIVPW
jgi:hypothetical protein